MAEKQISIELLKESDIPEVNNLYNTTYKTNRSIEEFKWEFFEAPAGKAVYVVAKDINENKIIGTQAAIPIILQKCNGEKFLSAKSEDTLVDSNYRGLKIFDKMYDRLFEECKKNSIYYIWGFTSALKPFSKLGFEIPYSHSQSLFVNNIKFSYKYLENLNPKNKLINKLKIAGLTLISKAFAYKLKYTEDNFTYKITEIFNSENLEPLQRKSCNEENFFILQDTNYFNWRINQNPYINKFVIVKVYENNELITVLLLNEHKINVWYIIQLLFKKDLDKSLIGKVVANCIYKFNKSYKPNLIRSWNFSHNIVNQQEIKHFSAAGFTHLNRGIEFVWKDLTDEKTLNSKNFILSRIATQGII